MNLSTPKFLTILILLLVLAALGPIAVIWSLNTLFPALAIPYNLFTWLAALVLTATLSYKKS